jgi:hypothetical protein
MNDLFAQNRARFRREQEHIVRAKRNAQEHAQEIEDIEAVRGGRS